MVAPIQITAQRPQDRVVGLSDTPATRLASALASSEDSLQGTLQGLAKANQEKSEASARTDVLRTNGQALADAVREGKIEKTQNPYYIQAYERQAAAVTGREAVANLVGESQTWAERNDPAAYQKRFNESLGELAKGYAHSEDALNGFHAAAAPLQSQAFQQNEAVNVARINQEHDANAGQLATTSVLAAVQATGGKPAPGDVYSALEPQHKSWLATGGTEADFDKLTINSVLGAAYRTGNASLLNVLDDNRGGKGALSSIAGPDGLPVAASLATARYRIEQAAEEAGMGAIKAAQHKGLIEGYNARQDLWTTFGADLLHGNADKAQIEQFLTSKGYSPQGINAAFGLLGKDVSESNAFTRALMKGDPHVFEVYTEANRDGYSKAFEGKVADLLRNDVIDLPEATTLLSTATGRSNHLDSEARSDARSAKAEANANAREARALKVQETKDLKEHRQQLSGDTAVRLKAAGIRTLDTPKVRAAFDKSLLDAESSALLRSDNDPKVAREAVRAAAAQFIAKEAAKKAHRKAMPTPGASPANARR